ncbi:alcohol acetyltransferase [Lipomyces japonicus]|uniref:alcohol acetyltransferase n=1 Tax=Lipomyces japonicus TaxID=56871 RepID=UPI0034CF2F5E
MTAAIRSRPAGLLEKYMIARAQLDYYRSVVVWTEVSAIPPLPVLHAGLAKLISQHAALRSIVIDAENRSPKIGILDEISLDRLVEVDDDDVSLEDYLVRATNVKFDYADHLVPLWKVKLWRSQYVFFICDHAPFDGTSAAIFQRDLLKIVNNHGTTDAIANLRVLFDRSVPPAPEIEQLVKISPPVSYVLSVLGSEFGPSFWPFTSWQSSAKARDPLIWRNYVDVIANQSCKILNFSSQQAGMLLRACRDHGTTLTALLNTVLVVAASKAYPSTGGFDTSIPINARRFCLHDDYKNAMGAYVFQYKEITPAVTDFRWTDVTRFGHALKAGTTYKAGWILGMLKYLFGNISEWMEGKIGKERDNDVEVSNIGTVDFSGITYDDDDDDDDDDDGVEFKVKKIGFTQPHGILNPPLKLNVAGLLGGAVTIVFGYSDEIVGHGKGELIFNEIKHLLEQVSDA